MARYRSTQYKSEEAKRNIKVDLRRIPEWEAELESMRKRIDSLGISNIVAAANLIYANRGKFSSIHRITEKDEQDFKEWKESINVENLLWFKYFGPSFLRYGYSFKSDIENEIYEIDRYLSEAETKGVTDSFLVGLFTPKMDANTVARRKESKVSLLSFLQNEIPKIDAAYRLISEVKSISSNALKIKNKLNLATEKKEAIERFDAKHGNAFAKAAVADGKTRSRATSLKRLVKKTKGCPYCGNDLGTNPHLDHIYPVSKGGLSIVENLVWCCSTCNGLKTDKGLMQFLKERDLSIEQTLTRLHSIGKHV